MFVLPTHNIRIPTAEGQIVLDLGNGALANAEISSISVTKERESDQERSGKSLSNAPIMESPFLHSTKLLLLTEQQTTMATTTSTITSTITSKTTTTFKPTGRPMGPNRKP